MVWFLHQGGGGLSSGCSVSKSVSVAMIEMARATARMLPPANPMNTKYGIPKRYLYWIFILLPSVSPTLLSMPPCVLQ